jgi:acetate kinase
MFCYRILKYLGAYVSVLNGIDAFVFSGGIGENSPEVRAKVLNQAQLLKVNLDQKMNDSAVDLSFGEVKKISSLHSALDVFVIATDENVFIAKEALRFFLAY